MQEFVTVCPRNCYSTCSFRVQVEKNRIVRILPDSSNLATPEGPCIKGLSYIERSLSGDRILKPLLKDSEGNFTEISRKKALDVLTEKLSYYKKNYGNKSILYYSGSGISGLTNEIAASFWKAFGGASLTYGNFCWPAGLEAVRLTLGENKHNVPWDLVNASLIIIWGKNPAETNVQEMAFIDKAIDRGSKVVVIDPRRTPTADKADILLRIKPGTDAALALAIADIIVEKGRVDKQFIANNVNGFDEFASSFDMSPAQAALITGIPEKKIEELAEMIAGADAMTILPGYGMQRYTNGGQTIRALLALNIITGNIGKKGSGFNYANLQSYVFDDAKEPLSYYPWINESALFRRNISMAGLAEDIINERDPAIHMAWIERGNPLTQAPDTNLLKKAFAGIGFKVVIDQFLTDTAREADLVLPAKNMFEQADIVSSYWSPYVSYRPRVLEIPGDVMPETELYYELAQRLGMDTEKNNIPAPGDENLDTWLENRIKGTTKLSLDNIKLKKQLAPGLQEVAFIDHKYLTDSGRIELYSRKAKELWNVGTLPEYNRAFVSENKGNRFFFMTPNTHYRIHSQFGNLGIIKKFDPEPLLAISPEDADDMDLTDGDKVRVFNERGEITLKVKLNARMKNKCVSLPNGWWASEGACGNFLSAGRETDMGHGTAFHDNLVSIEKTT
ncbi:MAG: molybdopterin-dependent oxidoreductase [Bacteroidales bacterium]|nr:molybdopterin-dependent oxidoreductase [Bacteroidales bacterium]